MLVMIAKLLTKDTETDRLGNEVETGRRKIAEAPCRITPWTPEEIQTYGRELTETRQKIAVMGNIEENPDYMQIGNSPALKVYGQTEYFGRWTCYQVERWRR